MTDCPDIEAILLEFAEFKAEAKEYEAELEAELTEKDRQLIDLTYKLDMTEERLRSLQAAYGQSEEVVGRLTRQLKEMTDKEAKARTTVRRLENDLDALESSLRSTEFSKVEMEEQLYAAKEEGIILKEMLTQTEERERCSVRHLEERYHDLADELVSQTHCQRPPTTLYLEVGSNSYSDRQNRKSGSSAGFPFEHVFDCKEADSAKFAPVGLRLEEFKKGKGGCVLVAGSENAGNVTLMHLKKSLLYLKGLTPLTLRCEEVGLNSKTTLLKEVHAEPNLMLDSILGHRLCKNSSLVWTFTSADAAFQIVELSANSLQTEAQRLIFDGAAYSKIQDTLLGQALASSMKPSKVNLMSYLLVGEFAEGRAASASKIPKATPFKTSPAKPPLFGRKQETERNVKSYALKCVLDLEKELAGCKSTLKVKEARITALTSRLKRKELTLRQCSEAEEKLKISPSNLSFRTDSTNRTARSLNSTPVPGASRRGVEML